MIKRISSILVLFVLFSGCTSNLPDAVITQEEEINPLPPTWTETASPVPATDTPPLPTPSDVPTAAASATPAAFGPNSFPADISPLSGRPAADLSNLERRPVAIKIQIFPRGQRPAHGVSLADVVYDYYQNFGLTRLHAIFYGQNAETVGPIRSARLLDIDLIQMYKSVFVFGGAETRTRSRLFGNEFANRLVVEGNDSCPPLCRVDPEGFNYLMANTAEVSTYATEKGIDNTRQNMDGMRFDPITPPGGQAGEQAYVRFSISAYTRWDYDFVSGRYLRYQDVQEAHDLPSEAYEPFIDGLTGQQVAADNVVVVLAAYQYAFNTHPGPSEVVRINLDGTGPAYAFRDGQMYEVTWNRSANDSVLYLTNPDGTPFPFKPGNTWFQVIGTSSKVEIAGDRIWRFIMAIP